MPAHPRNRPLALVALCVCLASCRDATAPSAPVQEAPATLRALPRPLTDSELSVRDAADAFSFALWHAVNAAQPDANVFISPLSASFALGMTMNGADSVTYDQMAAALQFAGTPLASINAGYRSLIALLQSLDPGVTMQIANSIWYRSGFPVLPSFVDTTRTYFDATVKGLDFSDVQGSLATINHWVDSTTNGRIPAVLDSIDPSEQMFLMNAIYFKGSWRSRFNPDSTTAAAFASATNGPQTVQLMHQVNTLPYAETAAYQAVDLAYGDSAFTMTVLLPKPGTDIDALAASLTPGTWSALTAGLRVDGKVDLSLPKLTLSYERQLKPDLMSLGMVEPFDGNGADFTRMAAPPLGLQLFIDFVQQNTFVDIDEEGTEAAAVTTVGISFTSAPLGPVVMRVDRPYLFVIRENLTGTVLFMGKVVNMP